MRKYWAKCGRIMQNAGCWEAVTRGVLKKKLILKISPYSQENTCVGVSFNKVSFLIKKRLQHRCLPVNIANLLRAPILKKICERLLPSVCRSINFSSTLFVSKTRQKNSIIWSSVELAMNFLLAFNFVKVPPRFKFMSHILQVSALRKKLLYERSHTAVLFCIKF